jgi:hypothetical protein
MKGMVMAQRILIAACLLMVVACCSMAGVVWSQSTRSAAQAAEANRRLAELLGQTQVTNQEMLKQLQAMAKPAPPAKSQEWVPVSFKLTVEKPDGPPAVGYEVDLERSGGSLFQGSIHRSSDAVGIVDFGVVQPGNWDYRVKAGPWEATGGLNVIPGSPTAQSIVCPKVPPSRVSIRVRVDLPAGLAGKDLKVIALLRKKDVAHLPPLSWKSSSTSEVHVLCLPKVGQLRLDQELKLHAVCYPGPGRNETGDELLASGRIHGHLHSNPSISAMEPIDFEAGLYSLDELIVIRPRASSKPSAGEVHDVLCLMNRDAEGASIGLMLEGSDGESTSCLSPQPAHGIRINPTEREKLDHFDARPGQIAEWVISLPEGLIKEVERKLKPDTNARRAE